MSENTTYRQLTLLSEDGPAKTSVLQAQQDQGYRASGRGFGKNITGLFAKLNQAGSWLRTIQIYWPQKKAWVLGKYSGSWPRSGMMQSGKCYRQPRLGHLTSGTDYSWLPTPTRSMGKRGWGIPKAGKARYSKEKSQNALAFGYRPPMELIEWMMGFPAGHTEIE